MHVDNEKVVAMLDEVCRLLMDITKQQDTIIESKLSCEHLEIKVFRDGDQWCAMHGENPMIGIQGFGDTPNQAVVAFDLEYRNNSAKTAYALEKTTFRRI
jgi:hypothetical protein